MFMSIPYLAPKFPVTLVKLDKRLISCSTNTGNTKYDVNPTINNKLKIIIKIDSHLGNPFFTKKFKNGYKTYADPKDIINGNAILNILVTAPNHTSFIKNSK